MASKSSTELIFITNKPRLRTHNKSHGGCSTCKARKVKCPENRPICRTCARRGETCVYPDGLKGVNATEGRDPVTKPITKDAEKTPIQLENDEHHSDTFTNGHYPSLQVTLKPGHHSRSKSPSFTLSTPESLPWIDADSVHVVESCHFYNGSVVKEIAPAHAPFQRVEIPVEVWMHHVPKMLQHIWIALMKTMQASRTGVDPSQISDLCLYRGSGIKALRESLPDAANDPHGLVLSCVITMMTADMYTGGPWTTHLEAARRIMVWNGGFRQCFENIWSLRRMLVNYLIADVFTATMFDSRMIDTMCSEMHAEYIEVLEKGDYDVFACSRPCPRPLIQAIVRVNMLRASMRRQGKERSEKPALEMEEIWSFIDAFDPTSWVMDVADLGKPLPRRSDDSLAERDVTALASYASCYHAAVRLYFLLSCALSLTLQDKLRVRLASQNLIQHIRILFETAHTDSEGPLHTQLWKLLSWPILIGTYVRAGWDIGEEDVQTQLERRHKIDEAQAFGRRESDVAKCIRRVEAQRARRSAAEWTWDDGFYGRCSFAL